eukprot:scaffold28932_cov17-Tisochrysis_lutea.AAC.1
MDLVDLAIEVAEGTIMHLRASSTLWAPPIYLRWIGFESFDHALVSQQRISSTSRHPPSSHGG